MQIIKTKLLLIILLGTMCVADGVSAQEVLGDFRFERDTTTGSQAFPPSIFQHWKHRIHYRCDACHDSLFEMKRGGTVVTMDLIEDGKACGICHNDKLAFATSISDCNKCHTTVEAE